MKGLHWAAALALLGCLVLASIPVGLVRYFRERASEPARSVANGTVVEVSGSGERLQAVIEYTPGSSRPSVRVPTDMGPGQRRLQLGDPVLIEYDPKHPQSIRVWSVQPLWSQIWMRAMIGAALLTCATTIVLRRWLRRV